MDYPISVFLDTNIFIACKYNISEDSQLGIFVVRHIFLYMAVAMILIVVFGTQKIKNMFLCHTMMYTKNTKQIFIVN